MRSVGQRVLNDRSAAKADAGGGQPPPCAGTSPPNAFLGAPPLPPAGRRPVDVAATFSFHRPPYNSIDHLHMHCIGANRARRAWPVDYLKAHTHHHCNPPYLYEGANQDRNHTPEFTEAAS